MTDELALAELQAAADRACRDARIAKRELRQRLAADELSKLRTEPGSSTPRGAISNTRKARIHALRKGKCWMCGQPVAVSGPEVRYDHRLPLELGGSDDDDNLWPLHRAPCDKLKTAADASRIAKAKRQAKKATEPRKASTLKRPRL